MLFSQEEEDAAGSGIAAQRALADPHRHRLIELLREADEPLGTAALARALQLHPNTVRWHLRVLEEAHLVTGTKLPSSGRGRPRIGYTPVERTSAAQEYRLLASLLAGSLADLDGGPDRAEAAGRSWGAYLVERPQPGPTPDATESTALILRLLGRHGFDPVANAGDIVLRTCPFAELARTRGSVICRAHRGIVDGALSELGAPLHAAALDPFTGPGLCLLRLEPTAAETAPAAAPTPGAA